MQFLVGREATVESGLIPIPQLMTRAGIFDYFRNKGYGESIGLIVVMLWCREPEFASKPHIRYMKATKALNIDIQFDQAKTESMETDQRHRFVAQKLLTEVPRIIAKYKFPDFDLPRFENDLKEFFNKLGWLESK
jgi:hypothetical protein